MGKVLLHDPFKNEYFIFFHFLISVFKVLKGLDGSHFNIGLFFLSHHLNIVRYLRIIDVVFIGHIGGEQFELLIDLLLARPVDFDVALEERLVDLQLVLDLGVFDQLAEHIALDQLCLGLVKTHVAFDELLGVF